MLYLVARERFAKFRQEARSLLIARDISENEKASREKVADAALDVG